MDHRLLREYTNLNNGQIKIDVEKKDGQAINDPATLRSLHEFFQ